MKQKVFLSRDAIFKAIDVNTAKRNKRLSEAERCEQEIRLLKGSLTRLKDIYAIADVEEQIKYLRATCEKFKRSAARYEESRLPKLKAALAEMDTRLLGIDDNQSVVLK